MKILKLIPVTLILGGLLAVTVLGCASESDMAESENQIATVQRGDLTVDITAVGNLELSYKEDLAFEIAGTVEEVLVEEGDTVEDGQVLVKLDTSEWEDELTALERQVTAKELDLLQAQINLQTAEDNLSAIAEVAEAQDDIDDAEYDLKFAQTMWEKAVYWEASEAELNFWRDQITSATARLAEAQQELREVLAGSSAQVTTEVAIEVAMKKLKVELAQWQLEDAQIALEDAQRALDEALNISPKITAPFAGFITNVSVIGGEEVKKGTVAVTIADPNKFEAELLVSEMDIFQIKLGGEAWVQVDAMTGMSLPAEVTHISPTATISQGVVNYTVKVEVGSLSEMVQEQQAARQETIQDIQQGELPERLKQAIEEGLITQEQVEEMMRRIQSGEMPSPPEGFEGEIPSSTESGQVPMMSMEDFQLREGLTVTVSIIVEERSNVLLVPNGAITTQGQQTYVQVVAPDGSLEERAIQTGITNYQFTEVTEGLSEGEQVAVPQGTTTTTTTQQQGPPGGAFFVPGMGR